MHLSGARRQAAGLHGVGRVQSKPCPGAERRTQLGWRGAWRQSSSAGGHFLHSYVISISHKVPLFEFGWRDM
ncbi:hypothetical protein BRADI_3g45373v3 [Brachypodium distachyon]|uniref:Uncharacterized protein n=1 Tax=Brachypodium distachyon TaxID=15368 RepID=A0A0Q3FKJ1_BRADI|nr:hypothetical protein BRADI_3g45373v3 [Brachypodium distachyon]